MSVDRWRWAGLLRSPLLNRLCLYADHAQGVCGDYADHADLADGVCGDYADLDDEKHYDTIKLRKRCKCITALISTISKSFFRYPSSSITAAL